MTCSQKYSSVAICRTSCIPTVSHGRQAARQAGRQTDSKAGIERARGRGNRGGMSYTISTIHV